MEEIKLKRLYNRTFVDRNEVNRYSVSQLKFEQEFGNNDKLHIFDSTFEINFIQMTFNIGITRCPQKALELGNLFNTNKSYSCFTSFYFLLYFLIGN